MDGPRGPPPGRGRATPPGWNDDSASGQGSGPDGSWRYGWGGPRGPEAAGVTASRHSSAQSPGGTAEGSAFGFGYGSGGGGGGGRGGFGFGFGGRGDGAGGRGGHARGFAWRGGHGGWGAGGGAFGGDDGGSSARGARGDRN